MTTEDLKQLARQIVADARRLSAVHTSEGDAPVNYACVFTQSPAELQEMLQAAHQLGRVVEDTPSGPVFLIPPLTTEAGVLRLLKIRRPDPKRPERGDADFTVADYPTFKKAYLGKAGFGLIERPSMEMMELADPSFDVLAYYSHPPLATVLKITLDDWPEPAQR